MDMQNNIQLQPVTRQFHWRHYAYQSTKLLVPRIYIFDIFSNLSIIFLV